MNPIPVTAVLSKPSGFVLCVQGHNIKITNEDAHLILTKILPEDQLLWSVNTTDGDFFYDSQYPDWSVKAHPSEYVSGNTYYPTKAAATAALTAMLRSRIDDTRRIANTKTDLLMKRLNAIINPPTTCKVDIFKAKDVSTQEATSFRTNVDIRIERINPGSGWGGSDWRGELLPPNNIGLERDRRYVIRCDDQLAHIRVLTEADVFGVVTFQGYGQLPTGWFSGI